MSKTSLVFIDFCTINSFEIAKLAKPKLNPFYKSSSTNTQICHFGCNIAISLPNSLLFSDCFLFRSVNVTE